MIYKLPNFKKFKPLKLNIELEKLKKKYDNLIYKEDNNALLFLVQKVFNKKALTNKEIGKILYNYSEVREIAGFEEIIKKEEFLENFKKINLKIVKQNIKKIFDLLYQNIISNGRDDIQEEINEIGNYFINYGNIDNKILNDFTNIILEFFSNKINIIEFLEEKFSNYIHSEEDYNYFSILYRIDKETDAYKKVILLYFRKRLIEELALENERINEKDVAIFSESILNLEIKSEFYKIILKYYFENNIDVDKYSKSWFENILLYMGNPENNEKWNDIKKDYIEMFNNWLVYRELYEIFILNVQDNERLEFWKKYVNVIDKIEFIEELHQAIIMETNEHTFIEFGKRGNACYIYNKDYRNIIIIKEMIKKWTWSIVVKKIKSRETAINYISHIGWWQSRFKLELARLGYKVVDKNVQNNKKYFHE